LWQFICKRTYEECESTNLHESGNREVFIKRKDWKQLAQEIAVEDDPHKQLSLIRELNVALEERATELRSGPPLPKRLLFVDDEESIRLTLPLILQRRGFEVRVAASVPEAIAEIQNHDFDVLLSDLNIGKEGDGFDVVRAMREANPKCVTVLLTGYPAFETAVQAIRYDLDDYFVKPADIDLLVSAIERKLVSRTATP
jgi:ActR/RegA family two-component response regulator